MKRFIARFLAKRLPKAHGDVLLLMAELDRGDGVEWHVLRDAAASKGISEHELEIIVYGKLREDALAGR